MFSDEYLDQGGVGINFYCSFLVIFNHIKNLEM